jgi:hypothetical protein
MGSLLLEFQVQLHRLLDEAMPWERYSARRLLQAQSDEDIWAAPGDNDVADVAARALTRMVKTAGPRRDDDVLDGRSQDAITRSPQGSEASTSPSRKELSPAVAPLRVSSSQSSGAGSQGFLPHPCKILQQETMG